MRDFTRDLEYEARMLWKSKGFTLVAVVSRAPGICFNTTIFSAVDAVLLRPKAGFRPESLLDIYLSDSWGRLYAIVGVISSPYTGGIPRIGMRFWAPSAWSTT